MIDTIINISATLLIGMISPKAQAITPNIISDKLCVGLTKSQVIKMFQVPKMVSDEGHLWLYSGDVCVYQGLMCGVLFSDKGLVVRYSDISPKYLDLEH